MAMEGARQSGTQEHQRSFITAAAIGLLCAAVVLFQSLLFKVLAAVAAGAAMVAIFAHPELGISLLILLLPLQNLFPKLQGAALTSIQPATIMLPALAMVFATRAWISRDFRVRWTPLSTPVLAFAAGLMVLVVARLLIERPSDELLSVNVKMVGRFIMGTALFFLITQFFTTAPRLRMLVWAFVIGGTVATLIGLAQYFLGFELVTSFGREDFEVDAGDGGSVTRVKSTLGLPHGFAFLAAILVLLMVSLAVYAATRRKRVFYASAAMFYLVGLFTTQARAGLLFVAVGLAVLMLRRRKYALLAGLFCALIAFQMVATAFPGIAGRFGKTFSSGAGAGQLDYSTMHRMQIFGTALDAIETNPLVGTGLIYLYMKKPGSAWTAHNSFLDMWIAGGVVLMGLFAWLLWRGIREAWRRANPRPASEVTAYASWLLATFAGITAFVMVDVLEVEYYRPISFYCLLAICAVITRAPSHKSGLSEIDERL